MTTSGPTAPRAARDHSTVPPQAPPTRGERQQQTRMALLAAARTVFARDGYHGARLEAIAHEAGYSKGAVYSNFDGKGALFLAVVDADLNDADTELARDGVDPWNLCDAAAAPTGEPGADTAPARTATQAEIDTARGFARASLEFIAIAGRDPALAPELEARMHRMLAMYTDAAVANSPAPADDPLPTTDLGLLLAAFEQGSALLALGGIAPLPDALVREGMLRLLAPRPSQPTTDQAPQPPDARA
ncbi:TetR/AcrR family transcriptional regulator [Cellulomonas sp. P22]|uniref:TetR/AcrR family transcriptional regulator n=1 Tax=Cellulomonas sp. P22 TaxID=3373189 RepID=UPI0037B85AB7